MFLTCKLKAYCSYILEFCFLYSSASFPLKYFYLVLYFPFSTMMTFSYHRGMCFMGSHSTLPDPNCYKAPSPLVPLCLVQMSIVNPYGGFCAFGMLPSQQQLCPHLPCPLTQTVLARMLMPSLFSWHDDVWSVQILQKS